MTITMTDKQRERIKRKLETCFTEEEQKRIIQMARKIEKILADGDKS